MKKTSAFFAIIFVCILKLSAQTYSFTFEGTARKYIVHLPTGYNPANKFPLVLNLHGLGSYASQQQLYSGMDATSDKYKFIVVYPDGVNNAWNVGIGLNASINDVGYINALLDTLIKKYAVNTGKIYSCGLSLGGYMTYKLGCELSQRFTAIASVSGVVSSGLNITCKPVKFLPLLHIHGTADDVVAYGGSNGSLGAEASAKKWVGFDHCSNLADTTHVPDINKTDQSTADLIKFQACSKGLDVWFYKIYNGGHTWPGAIDIPNKVTNKDFNASDEIWKFFDRFPLIATGITDDQSTKVEIIYPNPVNDNLYISGSFIQQVQILNLNGIIVQTGFTKENLLNVSSLQKGIYLLQTVGSKSVSRFIKE